MADTPIAYGYVRIRPEADEDELRLVEKELSIYADAHGLDLARIYYDDGPGISPDRMVRRLTRDDVHHLVVSSLEQITEHLLVGELMEAAVEWEAGATLHEASVPVG
ncbi:MULTISPECIES: recombinase family protein [unclassified Streptomyces]|uniref:recombinase family protein n=1 Tax=unclassified Streptomyces TaxID=2593676 RepID=UPI0008238B8E|nr:MULTISPECIES: recombinase family protein [unclassified Streptomyces]MYT96790.1 hypothetical protein [Streptomyces sp. SID8350]SCK59303.1 hypothetical protein YUWDRAFT_05567 [Streptomyces sp. AmelKG-D3]